MSTKSTTLIDASNRKLKIDNKIFKLQKGANPGRKVHPWRMEYN